MLWLILSFVYCDTKLEQQKDYMKKILDELGEKISNGETIQQEINSISAELKSLSKQVDEIKSTTKEIDKSYENIKKIGQQDPFSDIQSTKYLSKYFKLNPINISLMYISSGFQSKGILNRLLHGLFPASEISPILPKNQFWNVNSKSASFTFLADFKSKAVKFQINQTNAEKCGISKFRLRFHVDNTIKKTKIFELKQNVRAPMMFDLNQTYWFRTFDLEVLENFGDNFICLPNVRIFDNDIYSN